MCSWSCSDTDDAEGNVTPVNVAQPPERAAIEKVLTEFLGECPGAAGLLGGHGSGQARYALARWGEAVNLSARAVRIDAIEVLGYNYPRLEVEVHCGKGTVHPFTARDLGERLGCGGLIEVLRRTRVGPFTAEAGAEPRSGCKDRPRCLAAHGGRSRRADPHNPFAGRCPPAPQRTSNSTGWDGRSE